jgi:hypothetical protein
VVIINLTAQIREYKDTQIFKSDYDRLFTVAVRKYVSYKEFLRFLRKRTGLCMNEK